jgi:hypothetical protein
MTNKAASHTLLVATIANHVSDYQTGNTWDGIDLVAGPTQTDRVLRIAQEDPDGGVELCFLTANGILISNSRFSRSTPIDAIITFAKALLFS